MARTSIDVDERLLRLVMQRHGLGSPAAAVDLALRRLLPMTMSNQQVLAQRGRWFLDEDRVDRRPLHFDQLAPSDDDRG